MAVACFGRTPRFCRRIPPSSSSSHDGGVRGASRLTMLVSGGGGQGWAPICESGVLPWIRVGDAGVERDVVGVVGETWTMVVGIVVVTGGPGRAVDFVVATIPGLLLGVAS